MPVLHQEGYLSADDVPAMEILQRRSINSLFGLPEGLAIGSPEPDPFRFDAPRSFRIPIGRVPMLDEFPDGPEGGRIPQFGGPAGRGGSLDSPDSSASARSNPDAPAADPMATDFERLLSISPRERRRGRAAPARDCAEAGPRAGAFAWRGSLPLRPRFPTGGFSPKIFLGGLPWDVDEKTLVHTFRRFGPIRVDWPGRESDSPQPKGFVYAVFQTERQVRCLLAASVCDGAGDWYFTVSTRKMRSKQVQIIPWDLRDSNFVKDASVKLDPSRTVFVGALHGMLTAEGLARIMDDLFGGVVFAGIDTDRHKYPIGSGRVTFDNPHSYARAVGAAFVDVKTEKFRKKIQVDPYLEDSICSVCNVQQGPYFCRTPSCFEYFCRSCWQWRHARDCHRPLTRSKCPPPRRDSAPARGDFASARGLGGDAR